MNRILILVILAIILSSLMISFSSTGIGVNKSATYSILNNPTHIVITTSRYIHSSDDRLLRAAYYFVTVSVNEPIFYARSHIRDYIVKPKTYQVKPGETITVNTRDFAKAWIPFRDGIVKALKNPTITPILPTITISITAITWNAETYTFIKILDSKTALFQKIIMKHIKPTPQMIYKVLLKDPLSVFHGLTVSIDTNKIIFSHNDISKYMEKKIMSEKRLLRIKSAPFSPYDPEVIYYIPLGDPIGFVPGSIFDEGSEWYKLYASRNNPPENWSNRIVVGNGLNKTDVIHGTWYQLAYYFSGFFYIDLNSVNNNMEEAIDQLVEYASSYIPSQGWHYIGYTDLLSLLYAKYKHTGGYYDIDWVNTWEPGKEWIKPEPIIVVWTYKAGVNTEYLPLIRTWFYSHEISVFTSVHVFAGQAVGESRLSIKEIDPGPIYFYKNTHEEELAGYIFKYTYIIYGGDAAVIHYDFIKKNDTAGHNYLLLIPIIDFSPSFSKAYNISSIQKLITQDKENVTSNLNTYVDPYIWNSDGGVTRYTKTFASPEDMLYITYSFIHDQNSNIKYSNVLALLPMKMLGTVISTIASESTGGVSDYFLMLANLFSEERFCISTSLNVFKISIDITAENDSELVGYHIVVYTPVLPKNVYPSNENIMPLFEIQVFAPYSQEPPQCDPTSGICTI